MPLRLLRRPALLGLVTALAASLLAAGAVVMPAASARVEPEPLRPKVERGWKTSVNYDGMLVNDASSADPTPETCETVPWCALILIEPEFPAGFDPDVDEWLMNASVSWEDKPIVKDTAQGNDLDIYVYTYEDTLQDDGSYEKEYREVARSASARQPETMKLFGTSPANPTLYMVVYNFLGQNLGFRVDLDVKTINYADPDSYLAGSAGPGASAGAGGEGSSSPSSSSSSSSDSAAASEPFEPTGAFTPRSPSELSPIAPLSAGSGGGIAALSPTAGFAEGFGDFRDLSEELAASPGGAGILDRIRNRTIAAPEDVPGAVLLFWLVFAPVAFAIAAFVMFLRRRPAALTLSFGAR